MILLYTALLALLSVVRFLVRVRVNALEKAYTRIALKAEQLASQSMIRPGNSNQNTRCEVAKQSFELGKLVHQRDRLEAKHFRWQLFSEKFARGVEAVRNWKGQKLPYTLGVVDVSMVMVAIDKLGLGNQINFNHLYQLVTTWISG
jgi:hypothetical protein